MTFYQQQDGDLILHCLIQPKASRDEIIGVQEDRLKIRITAPPVDGKANTHLMRYLSDIFDVPRSRIELLRGDTGKRKSVKISGVATLPPAVRVFEESTL